MKVIYEQNILEKMNNAISEAKRKGLKIEKIVISEEEKRELHYLLREFRNAPWPNVEPEITGYCGYKVVVEKSV